MKEATQRCRNLGLNYEFVQTLVPDESDVFKAIVTIVDRTNNRNAEWPTARLTVWLESMRDNSDITAENAFDSVDIVWCENTEEIAMNESLNSSRISLNLSAMKETLLGKPMKSCFKSIQNRLSPWSFRSQANTPTQPKPNAIDFSYYLFIFLPNSEVIANWIKCSMVFQLNSNKIQTLCFTLLNKFNF